MNRLKRALIGTAIGLAFGIFVILITAKNSEWYYTLLAFTILGALLGCFLKNPKLTRKIFPFESWKIKDKPEDKKGE